MATRAKKKPAREKNPPARVRSPEIEVDDDDDLLDVRSDADASAADLDAVFAELGGNSNATITVTRVGANGREERCDRFMASELVGNFEVIRDRWGAGTYWLYGHDGKTLARKRPITFARSVDEQQRAGDPNSVATRSLAPADVFTAAIDKLATLQREQFQQMLTLMNGRQGAGLAEVVTLAEKMASLSGSRGGSSDVETLLRGFELARKIGAGGEEVSIGGALAEFVRAIREPALLPAPGASGASGASTATGGDHMQATIQRALAQQLPVLLRGAQSDSDVGVYAQLIFDQVPELYLRPMIEYLKKPDWFDLLARADGRVVPCQAWFEALRSEILRATSPEPPPAP